MIRKLLFLITISVTLSVSAALPESPDLSHINVDDQDQDVVFIYSVLNSIGNDFSNHSGEPLSESDKNALAGSKIQYYENLLVEYEKKGTKYKSNVKEIEEIIERLYAQLEMFRKVPVAEPIKLAAYIPKHSNENGVDWSYFVIQYTDLKPMQSHKINKNLSKVFKSWFKGVEGWTIEKQKFGFTVRKKYIYKVQGKVRVEVILTYLDNNDIIVNVAKFY
jgi:hypothetical protein